MKSPFDVAALLLFTILAITYLHRSARSVRDETSLWTYALLAAACACGDVIANHGAPALGALLLVAAAIGVGWIIVEGRRSRSAGD